MIPRTVGCLWLVACASTPPPAPEKASGPDDLQRAEALLQLAVDEVTALDGRELQDTYLSTMELTDTGCPYLYGSEYWFGGCETSGGARFDGYVFEYVYDVPGESAWQLFGQATVSRPDGETLDLSGYAGWGSVTDAGVTWDYSYGYGTFRDPDAGGDWLVEGRSVALYWQRGTDGTFYVEGSLGGLDGDPGQAADFLEVSRAGEELLGVIGVRLPEGGWIDIFFDGREGCGEAFAGDDPIGIACADFGAWRTE